MNRPYTAPGIGWLLAVAAALFALLALLGLHLTLVSNVYFLILLVALAILL